MKIFLKTGNIVLLIFTILSFGCKEEVLTINNCNINVEEIKLRNFSPVANNGEITITVKNATPDLFYSIDSGLTFKQSEIFSNLPGGFYNIVIKNQNSCEFYAGEVISYATRNQTDSIKDIRDGKVYKTVKIGNQWWMSQNLNYGKMVKSIDKSLGADSLNTMTNNGIAEKYCSGDNEEYAKVYGGLYTWNECMNYNQNEKKGICPTGWHIPSDKEWLELEKLLGMSDLDLNRFGNRGKIAPLILSGASTGFNTLYAGYRDKNNGKIDDSNYNTAFWTSTYDYEVTVANRRLIYQNNNGIDREVRDKKNAYSVRCIKD